MRRILVIVALALAALVVAASVTDDPEAADAPSRVLVWTEDDSTPFAPLGTPSDRLTLTRATVVAEQDGLRVVIGRSTDTAAGNPRTIAVVNEADAVITSAATDGGRFVATAPSGERAIALWADGVDTATSVRLFRDTGVTAEPLPTDAATGRPYLVLLGSDVDGLHGYHLLDASGGVIEAVGVPEGGPWQTRGMLESERIAALRSLAAGEPVPVHDLPVRVWWYLRAPHGPGLGILDRFTRSGKVVSHIVEFPASDGSPLYAEMGALHGVGETVTIRMRVIGWPEIGGVVGVQFPDGSRQVAEGYVSHRKPRGAQLVAGQDDPDA